jgi:sarcosine oxidase gamma subunit
MSPFQVVATQPTARMGLKGPDAAALLQQAGITVPAAPNRIAASPTLRVLRLGNTEFILEQDDGDSAIAQVQLLARSAGLRAWPVTRADCSLLVSGDGIFDRLSRVCAFDFAQFDAQPDLAVMTLLADISVTFTLESASASRCLRLWTDPGFAVYLTQTLQSLSPDATGHGVHP